MSSQKISGHDIALAIVLGLLLSPFMLALQGWTLDTMWLWFLTPTFGVAAPGIINCIGICTIIRWLTPDLPARKSDEETATGKVIAGVFKVCCQCGVVLLMGWLLLKFS